MQSSFSDSKQENQVKFSKGLGKGGRDGLLRKREAKRMLVSFPLGFKVNYVFQTRDGGLGRLLFSPAAAPGRGKYEFVDGWKGYMDIY